MTPLERLGLEVAARRMIANGRLAGALIALVNGNGLPVTFSTIAAAGSRSPHWPVAKPKLSAKVAICPLRDALADMGLNAEIETVWGHGYSLPEPGRTAVIARLIEEAETC